MSAVVVESCRSIDTFLIQISLIIFGSLSFIFQGSLANSVKTRLLALLKATIHRVGATNNVSCIFTTQASTKMLTADGARGNFDTGAKGILVPTLGESLTTDFSGVPDDYCRRLLVCHLKDLPHHAVPRSQRQSVRSAHTLAV